MKKPSSLEVWRAADGVPTIVFVFHDGHRQIKGSPHVDAETIDAVLTERGLRFFKVLKAHN